MEQRYIFAVEYRQDERNPVEAYRLPLGAVGDACWERFLAAKVPDEYIGYLISDELSVKEVPYTYRKKYCEEHGRTLPPDRAHRTQVFLDVLSDHADEFSDEYLARLERAARQQSKRRKEPVIMASEAPTKKKPVKAKAAAKPKEKKAPAERSPRSKLDKSMVIEVLAESNPRRKGSKTYEIFNIYKSGMTVEKALEKGVRGIDIQADVERGHIKLKKAA